MTCDRIMVKQQAALQSVLGKSYAQPLKAYLRPLVVGRVHSHEAPFYLGQKQPTSRPIRAVGPDSLVHMRVTWACHSEQTSFLKQYP